MFPVCAITEWRILKLILIVEVSTFKFLSGSKTINLIKKRGKLTFGICVCFLRRSECLVRKSSKRQTQSATLTAAASRMIRKQHGVWILLLRPRNSIFMNDSIINTRPLHVHLKPLKIFKPFSPLALQQTRQRSR